MKLKNFLYLLTLLASSTIFAQDTVSLFNQKINALVQKRYDFFAFNKENIHYLTGRNRFKKISYSELISPKQFQKNKSIIDPAGIVSDILYFSKEKFSIIIRKDKKFYQLTKNKFVKFKAEQKLFPKKEFRIDKKKVLGVDLRKRHYVKTITSCIACELSMSGNYVTIDQSGQRSNQINSEFTLFSQFKFSPTSFIRYGFGVASYFLEDKKLNSVRTFGFKNQIFWRQNFFSIFAEVGGGINKFSVDSGYAIVQTARLGYSPQSDRWYATNFIFLKDFYISASHINWYSPIIEMKVGFSLAY
jgi:hypothetical protein